jgi:UrcA family protein
MYRFASTMLIFALSLGAQLIHADPAPDALSVTVHFADLDLTRSAGAAVVYQRLKSAAETVCGVESGSVRSRDLGSQKRFQECIWSAIGTAVAKVDQPTLTAYYRAQVTGNPTIRIAQK